MLVGRAMANFKISELGIVETIKNVWRAGNVKATTFSAAGNFLARLHHVIHEAVSLGLVGRHEIVAVAILLHLFDRLAGVLGDDFVEPVLEPQHFLHRMLHVAGLAFRAAPPDGS
jgi:hypothetical protein